MFHPCLKLFTRRKSRYISWNILLLWGFGLWIALCTSSMYQSDVLPQEAVMLYQQNWNSGTAYNIATKTTTAENLSHITVKNCTLCSIVLMVTAVLQYIYVLLLMCFVIPFICMRKHIRRRIKIPNNISHRIDNFHSIGTYLKTIVKDHEENRILDRKIWSKCNLCFLRSKMIRKCEINAQHLQVKLIYEWKEEFALEGNKVQHLFNADISIVQNEITFSIYTLLLFDNYELYRYFNNQQVKNACNLLTKYSTIQNSDDTKNDFKLSNYKNNCNLQLRKGIQKRIISSSPEFQKFLANLNRSRFFYPCMLEVSTSYIIRIKSVYN